MFHLRRKWLYGESVRSSWQFSSLAWHSSELGPNTFQDVGESPIIRFTSSEVFCTVSTAGHLKKRGFR